jgi:DNA-directed RNA polymerase specialized sigma24 family protein
VNVTSPRLVARITDPALAANLSRFVGARIPESDVEDVVQATLSDALQAEAHPETDEDIVRWVYGICRHKVIDWFRKRKREIPSDLEENTAAADSAPTSALDLMRWARKELPAGKENEQTLEWMLREGAGEKLENIAAEENVPAPRVRQRVSRLRRYFKAKWAAQAAAMAALLLVGLAIFFALRGKKEEIAPRPEPSFEPSALPLPPPVAPAPPEPLVPAGSTDMPDATPPSPSAPSSAPVPPPKPTTIPKATPAPTSALTLAPPSTALAAPNASATPAPTKMSKKAGPSPWQQSGPDSTSNGIPPQKPVPTPALSNGDSFGPPSPK